MLEYRKCLVLFEMGSIHLYKNEYEKASNLYEESKKIACKMKGDNVIKASILHQLGNVHFKKREFQAAIHAYTDSLEIKRKLWTEKHDESYKTSIGVTKSQIGKAFMQTQQQNKAISHLWQAHLLFENLSTIYDNMTQKDLQSIKDQLGEDEYDKILTEVKNHPLET
jgi:tetratricopeptide (TPR) repeat protein